MDVRVLRAAALACIALAAAALTDAPAAAQGAHAGAAMRRADATGIIRELRRIATPNGVQRANRQRPEVVAATMNPERVIWSLRSNGFMICRDPAERSSKRGLWLEAGDR